MCRFSTKIDGGCTNYYDPEEDAYEQINCSYCKRHMDSKIVKGQLHDLHFICDKDSQVEFGMRICYRYRNWYGNNDEFIFVSKVDAHYDFMKLCIDSKTITKPVVYSATGIYDGLSSNGNPLWIIIGNIKKEFTLSPYNEEMCKFKENKICNNCKCCRPFGLKIGEEIEEDIDLEEIEAEL